MFIMLAINAEAKPQAAGNGEVTNSPVSTSKDL
jgi:hypothetical protein